ncbi:MAG: hypothetical protein HYW49_02065 [Deltaproteobacteria bacterium]|nr:hypothetical protein [Deltaproteobacteria bacterium]
MHRLSRSPVVLSVLIAVFASICFPRALFAWDDHRRVTRLSLESIESGTVLPSAVFETLESALPAMQSGATREEFANRLGIRGEKVDWNWAAGEEKPLSAVEVLSWSAQEPDNGMDQDLDLGPDQKYMGGAAGPSSQGIRHMYFPKWDWRRPLATFHFPVRAMGMAPERAQLCLDLALRAAAGGHRFWSYRFLGWGLHYVEDMGQPYHASEFASVRLLPLFTLFRGWEAFIAETTRRVGNFHLAFEYLTDFLLDRGDAVEQAFRVPDADAAFKRALEGSADQPVKEAVLRLAEVSNALAPELAAAESTLMGKILLDRNMELIPGFTDAQGKPKIDFKAVLADGASAASMPPSTKKFFKTMNVALSNTGVAARWYVNAFILRSR